MTERDCPRSTQMSLFVHFLFLPFVECGLSITQTVRLLLKNKNRILFIFARRPAFPFRECHFTFCVAVKGVKMKFWDVCWGTQSCNYSLQLLNPDWLRVRALANSRLTNCHSLKFRLIHSFVTSSSSLSTQKLVFSLLCLFKDTTKAAAKFILIVIT